MTERRTLPRLVKGCSMKLTTAILLSILLAAWVAAQTTTGPSWAEHLDVVQFLVAALVAYLVWSAKRTLSKIETTMTGLGRRLTRLELAHTELVAQHDLMMASHHRHHHSGETPTIEEEGETP